LKAQAFLAAAVFVVSGCKAVPGQDVPYVGTPQPVLDEMLSLAQVRKGDVLYDLGSGDGRIVIAAAKRYGIRAVGIDSDPQRIAEANENARREGVAELVQFRRADLFASDFSEATTVTLYLLPELNLRLRPKLRALRPGARVVSHQWMIEGWDPDRQVEMEGHRIYLWTLPAR
jgi:SAM-dependent methyltransferase